MAGMRQGRRNLPEAAICNQHRRIGCQFDSRRKKCDEAAVCYIAAGGGVEPYSTTARRPDLNLNGATMSDPQDEIVSVYKGENVTEAHLVKNLLLQAGIDAHVTE